jgi:MYXO-CTERM domain-containing protein
MRVLRTIPAAALVSVSFFSASLAQADIPPRRQDKGCGCLAAGVPASSPLAGLITLLGAAALLIDRRRQR